MSPTPVEHTERASPVLIAGEITTSYAGLF